MRQPNDDCESRNQNQVRVWITEIKSRQTLVIRWKLGKKTGQETVGHLTGGKVHDRKLRSQAELRAEEIRNNRTWAMARAAYERDYLTHLSSSNKRVWKTAADLFERCMQTRGKSLQDVSKLGRKDLEAYRNYLQAGRSPATVDTYVRTVKRGFSYFAENEWCGEVRGSFKSNKSRDKMRGRPLAGEEVDRIIDAVPKVIKHEAYVWGWQRLVRGLYLSGLRIEEALALSWDDTATHRLIVNERIPKIAFAPTQKNKKVQLVAVAPAFADFCCEVEIQTGWVFNCMTARGRVSSPKLASQRVSDFGAAAKVSTEPGRTATAHDLRRSCASHWSMKVMPPVLQHMMRHASPATTAKFYVQHTADQMGQAIADSIAPSKPPSNADHRNGRPVQ